MKKTLHYERIPEFFEDLFDLSLWSSFFRDEYTDKQCLWLVGSVLIFLLSLWVGLIDGAVMVAISSLFAFFFTFIDMCVHWSMNRHKRRGRS